jgi:elongation factor G
MLDGLSMFSDELTEAILDEKLTEDLIRAAIRSSTIKRQVVPVMMGSAFTNRAVQPLLDGIAAYLPSPMDIAYEAIDPDVEDTKIPLEADPDKPLVMLAFKLEDGRYGQLTYMRVYQGSVHKGTEITNVRTGKRHKIGRLVRMHADEMEDIDKSGPGDIVAVFGIDCRSGDTFTDGTVRVSMASMHVPAPVISLTITPQDNKSQVNMSKALGRFTKEDPTFHVGSDPETNEVIISGMGELHLDVYIERMKREYSAVVVTSPPSVAYRESITKRVDFEYVHKKQTGGSGQYGKVVGYMEPFEVTDDAEVGGKSSRINKELGYRFIDEVVGGRIPREFIPAIDKGFESMFSKGGLIGALVRGVSITLTDGAAHAVDSSDMAFKEAAKGAWRHHYLSAKPQILEPVMKVEVEGPSESQGNCVAVLMQRRGIIVGTTESDGFSRIESEVPLAEMFGFSTVLRSATQGKAEFTMEFSRYAPVPAAIGEALVEEHRKNAGKKK